MSSRLERMIERTRAPLSGIEPLLQPRYAPQRAAGKGSSGINAMASAPEVSEFSSAELESNMPDSEAIPASQAANARTVSASEPRRTADRMLQRKHLPETQVVFHSSVSRGSAAELLPETQLHQNPPDSHDPAAEPLHGTQLHRAPVFQPATPPADHPTVTDDSTHRPVATKLASASDTALKQRAKAEPATAPPENKSYLPQQRELNSRGVTGPDKTSMDVTISIGHIEIRAVQAPEARLGPGFRPRVSLDDFLNRRNRERI
jgi:hypothetical protein